MKVILRMPFVSLDNIDIKSADQEFTWKTYINKKTLPITRRVELIDKKNLLKEHWMRILGLL